MIYITPTRTKSIENDAQCRSFEISDGNKRIGCTLTTHFETRDQASRFFYSNRPLLEQLARKKMATFGLDNGKIRLVHLP